MPSYFGNTEGIVLGGPIGAITSVKFTNIPTGNFVFTHSDYDIRAMCLAPPTKIHASWNVAGQQTGNKLPFLIRWQAGVGYLEIPPSNADRWTDGAPFHVGHGVWETYKRVYILAKSNPGGVFHLFEAQQIIQGVGDANGLDGVLYTTAQNQDKRLEVLIPPTESSPNPTECYVLWADGTIPNDGFVLSEGANQSVYPLYSPGKGFVVKTMSIFNPTQYGGNKYYVDDFDIWDWGTTTGLTPAKRNMASNYATSLGGAGTTIANCSYDSVSELVSLIQNILIRAGWNISTTSTTLPTESQLDALNHSNKDIYLYYDTSTEIVNGITCPNLKFRIFNPNTTTENDRYHVSTGVDPVFGQIIIRADMTGLYKGLWDNVINDISEYSGMPKWSGNGTSNLLQINVKSGMYLQAGDYITLSGLTNTSSVSGAPAINGQHQVISITNSHDSVSTTNPENASECAIIIDYPAAGVVGSETLNDVSKRILFAGGEIVGGSISVGATTFDNQSVVAVSSNATDSPLGPLDRIVFDDTPTRNETTTTETITTTTTETQLQQPDNTTQFNGVYINDSDNLEREDFEILIKYTLYSGSDALIARKLVEMGVPVSPDNIKWYRTSMEVPNAEDFEMVLDDVEFKAHEYLPDTMGKQEGYSYDDEEQGV
jgi:hypothetical protein